MHYTSILFDLDGTLLDTLGAVSYTHLTLPTTPVCRSARGSRCAPRSATGRGG